MEIQVIVMILFVVLCRWLWKESNKPRYRCVGNGIFENDLLLTKEKTGRTPKGPMARKIKPFC